MVKRWINFIIFIGYFSYVLTHNCESDEDCAEGKVCRMICKRTCSATCVTINNLKNKHSKENRSSSEEPFAVETNPFDTLQRDEQSNVTPLTISEAELEAELKQGSADTTNLPLPSFENPTTFPTPPTPISEFTSTTTIIPLEASSPGQKPQPPGIDQQHESGYMPIPENITADITTVSPPTTAISNFIEPTSGGGGYDKGVDEFVQIESDNNNNNNNNEGGLTLPVSEATMFTESSFTTAAASSSSLPFETTDDTFNSTVATVDEKINNNNNIEEPLPNAVQGIPLEDPNTGCLPPQICEKNCGIFIDPNGCQICQCLWLSIPCEVSSDCVEEGQFCDLGRCECMPGYVQDMLQSGICKPDDTNLQNIAEVHSNSSTSTATSESNSQSSNNYPQNRHLRSKRSQTSEKPQRMERLQWPGPCDSDSQCPASLYCIQGDCWHLPDKPLRGISHQLHQDDEIPKSFPLESDEEASTATPLPPESIPLFDFKAFPRPPPSSPTVSPSKRIRDYEDAKPPSLRPLDYDETSFLGEFSEAFSVPTPTTTTERPITRMIAIEPLFIKSKRKDKPKKLHRGVTSFSSSSSTHRKPSPPHLEEILKPTSTSPNNNNNFFISSNIKKQSLSYPKYRNPQVSSEGWKPMQPHKVTAEFRLPTTTPMDEMVKVFLDYPNRDRHPVRVEMEGAKHIMRDECSSDRQCGEKYVCCEKRWCDLSRDCGKANFCLPNCRATKMTHLSSAGIIGMPLIDLVYD